MPFEEYELRLLMILANVIDYMDIANVLFKNEKITRYLVKKVCNLDNKILKDRKAAVIRKILMKGEKEWKGLELEYYCHVLEKELKGTSTEQIYALDVE